MRIVRFRGQDSNGKWHYGDLLHIGGGCIIYSGSQTEAETFTDDKIAVMLDMDEVHVVKPETIGQYVGIKDKNFKEIYSGDILQCGSLKFTVFYRDNLGGFVARNCDYDLSVYNIIPIGLLIGHDDFQVIGNVFDSPELIKSGTVKRDIRDSSYHFNYLDPVLVRSELDETWNLEAFVEKTYSRDYPYRTKNCYFQHEHTYCIPYNDETKRLLGTTDSDPYYF